MKPDINIMPESHKNFVLISCLTVDISKCWPYELEARQILVP
jgi:hypothetical protein